MQNIIPGSMTPYRSTGPGLCPKRYKMDASVVSVYKNYARKKIPCIFYIFLDLLQQSLWANEEYKHRNAKQHFEASTNNHPLRKSKEPERIL